MHITILSVLFLIVSAVSANIVPKDPSEVMHFEKTNESELGGSCEYDGLRGICTEMEKCAKFKQNSSSSSTKAANDPCANVRKTMVVCCINTADRKRPRVDSSTEEMSTDTIENV
uniref:Uncharacterized protein n=1 Tax=Anopheles coluzzii TaxID=1518534 RepID=A0A8W7PJS0_ANOCL